MNDDGYFHCAACGRYRRPDQRHEKRPTLCYDCGHKVDDLVTLKKLEQLAEREIDKEVHVDDASPK